MRLCFCLVTFMVGVALAEDDLAWSRLPSIPDPTGFAGSFAGIAGDDLLVAGGANFPNAKPWEGGAKVWHDSIFRFDEKAGAWKKAGRLPRPLGYGVSISTPESLICAGGSDAARHHDEVFRLSSDGAGIRITPLPPLPRPCANFCGALLGRTIHVAGGIEKPDATTALHTVWTLDLDHLSQGWRAVDPWPGKERMLAAAGVSGGSFFIVGGAALKPGADGKPERIWLQDGYRFTPGQGWRRIADAPKISVAAPSPMPSFGGNELFLIGGDDGAQLGVDPGDHLGFPREVFAFLPSANQWRPAGQTPVSLVTTPAVQRGDAVIIPGGEIRPGIRSTDVWSARLKPR